jgi:hypothetical protein
MEFKISIRGVELSGLIETSGIFEAFVVFVGDGDVRDFPYKKELIRELNAVGIACVICDLLTEKEEVTLKKTEKLNLLTERFIALSRWCLEDTRFKGLKQGYFGLGIGSAVALSTSAYWGTKVAVVVSYNGRPDMTMEELDLVESPVLLMVSTTDDKLVAINRQSYQKIGCIKKMEVVTDTGKICGIVVNWMRKYLGNSSI